MNFVRIAVTSYCTTFPVHSPVSSIVYFIVRDSVHQLNIIQIDFADIMKKECIIASKKNENYHKTKNCYRFRRRFTIFFCSLENINLSITVNIKDLLAPLTQQIRELRDFLNLHTKCMDQKPNFNNDFFDITCDKDLLVENEIF